jgi:Cu/Ag efflux pump CusA
MTRWNLSISDKTDRLVRSHLARVGMKKGDLSKFVDTAVRAEILRRTVKEVQAQNTDLTEEEAMALANEAVAWARAHPA